MFKKFEIIYQLVRCWLSLSVLLSTFVAGGIPNAAAANKVCTTIIESFSTRIALPADASLFACLSEIKADAVEGNIKAVVTLGYMAKRGIGVKRSARKARMAFEQGTEAGLPVAFYLLGTFYVGRLGATKDDRVKAEELLKRAIEAGEPAAATALADLYRSGKLGDKSHEEIERLYQLTSKPSIASLLGRAKLLMTSKGAKRDEQKAVKLFEQAASMGSAEAQFRVAMYWVAHNSDARKRAQAVSYLENASAAKYTPAVYYLGEVLLGSKTDAEKLRGLALVRSAADAGNADALYKLGDLYFQGKHVSANFGKAKRFWFDAAQAGSDAAKLQLLYQYEKLNRDEVLRLNGAFASAAAFTTDIGRAMLGNYYLARVARGQSGEYIKYENIDYDYAVEAYTLAAKSPIEAIAKPAGEIAAELIRGAHAYKQDLKARRKQRKIAIWVGVGAAAVALLSLAGRNSPYKTPKSTEYDSCKGIDGIGRFGDSYAGPAALAGCRPY